MTRGNAEAQRRRRARLRERGFCPGCGGTKTGDRVLCDECSDRHNERRRANRAAARGGA